MGYMKDSTRRRLDDMHSFRDVPGILGHWDASTLPGVNDQKIGIWADESGNGTDMWQTDVSKQPTVKIPGKNGLKTMSLASGRYMFGGGFGNGGWAQFSGARAQPGTVIIVAKGDLPVGASLRALWGDGWNLISEAGTANLRLNAGAGGSFWRGGIDGQWHIWVATYGTTSSTLARDGVVVATSASQSHGTGTLVSPTIGARTYLGADTWGPGEVAEVFLTGTQMAPEQWFPIVQYLSDKWAIPLGVDQQNSWPQRQDLNDAGGQSVRVWLPRDTSGPVPLLIYSHQQAGTNGVLPGYFTFTLVQTFVAAGWAVAIGNNHGGDSWTSAEAQTDLVNARTLVNGLVPVSDTVLFGMSMGGGLSSIVAANNLISDLRGVVLLDGAVNLRWMYTQPAYLASIATGLGLVAGTLSSASSAGATSISSSVSFPSGTSILIDPAGVSPETVTTTGAPTGAGPYTIPVPALAAAHSSGVVVSDYPVKAAGKDPALRPAADYGTTPFGFWASTQDTTVASAQNSSQLLTTLTAGGLSGELFSDIGAYGAHLAANTLDPGAMLAFAKRCID